MTAPLLQVDGLTKRFGGLVAVKDIGFAIQGGEILGMIGPNGSGKSTVMKCIMGIEHPNEGSVKLDGVEIAGWPTHRIARAGVGIVFQHARPLHRQTVLEHIKLALLPDSLLKLVADQGVEERAREVAARVGLDRVMQPPAGHPALRRSAPAGTGQGGGAQSQGRAGGRAVRRPDHHRGRHLLRADRQLPRRGQGGAAGGPQRQERRRAGGPGARHVSRRARRRGHRRRGDAQRDGARGLSRRQDRDGASVRRAPPATATACSTWIASASCTARRRRWTTCRCMSAPASSSRSSD